MISIQIGIYDSDAETAPTATVLQVPNGSRFIVLNPEEGVSIVLHGRNAHAVTQARALAECLNRAADEIELQLAKVAHV